MVPFSFQTREMALVSGASQGGGGPGAAVWWPKEQALLVADLHLEKASAYAARGQMLPPYDSRETLERLADAVRRTGARRVFALGDNFHDAAGIARLEPHAAGMLAALTRALDWVWIAGNHEGAARALPGGTALEELEVDGVILRHEALPDGAAGKGTGDTADGAAGGSAEISGHFHPRLALTLRGRRIVRPCAVRSERRLILPAFGALTGGMNAADPAILKAMQPARAIDALVPTSGKVLTWPLWRAGPVSEKPAIS